VSSGLVAGDKLVVEGLGRIKPGQKVKPVPLGGAAAPAAAN
jgi:membrane fusion protein (multidrug efflux system)